MFDVNNSIVNINFNVNMYLLNIYILLLQLLKC